jgi:hypothetical protein
MSSSSSSPSDLRLERLETKLDSEMREMRERHQSKMQEIIAVMNSRFDQLLDGWRTNVGSGSNNHGGGPRMTQTNGFTAPKVAKLDFPRYCGNDDPTSWICRVEQFFEFHATNENERLPLAAYHLDGDAQLRYQLFREGEATEVMWEALKKGLHTRYGPTMFVDFFGDLSKLEQAGSVRDYQVQFERLLTRVGRLASEHQIGCFVSGLKEDIRTEVQAARPTSLSTAMGLARLYEARQQAQNLPSLAELQKTHSPPPMPSLTLTKIQTPNVKS